MNNKGLFFVLERKTLRFRQKTKPFRILRNNFELNPDQSRIEVCWWR